MKEFEPKVIEELKLRVEGLSQPCRSFMALDFALQNPTLTKDEKLYLQDKQNILAENMTLSQKAELLTHKQWLKERKVIK